MSGSTFAFSTFAQLCELGTYLLFVAALKKVVLMPVPRFSIVVVLGMTPPTVAISAMCLLPVSVAIQALAQAWCLLRAATPRSDPPRNTGAVWPELWLGIGKAPSCSLSAGLPDFGSVMTPTSQPLATIIAMWPCAKAASCLASSPVLSARESLVTRLFSVVRPCWALDESRAPLHLPPDWVAMSPPKSQTKGSAAYQYLPGK